MKLSELKAPVTSLIKEDRKVVGEGYSTSLRRETSGLWVDGRPGGERRPRALFRD